jgi:hypothetical protein
VNHKATRADKNWINRNAGKWTPTAKRPKVKTPADDALFDIDIPETPQIKISMNPFEPAE